MARNPGEYNKKINIVKCIPIKDNDGFYKNDNHEIVLKTFAKVKTTSGFTLIVNDSDFEKALTNFTIRYPKKEITRDMYIEFKGRYYSIEYLNNVDEANIELEIQTKIVDK